MRFFLYILKSISRHGKIYIGSTYSLEKRLAGHNRGDTRSTKYFIPWKIVYFEEYSSKKEAHAREIQIKKWKNRDRVESLISNMRP